MEKIINNKKYIIKHLYENRDCLVDIITLDAEGLEISRGTDLIVSDLLFTDEEKAALLPNEPTLTLDDYKTEKLIKLYDYDKSDAVNSFNINGVSMWLDNETRRKLKFRIDAEKTNGRTGTTLWFDGMKFTFLIVQAEEMLSALEVYASECYDQTAQHKRNIKMKTNVNDILDYDFTTGYPLKLNF